MLFTEAGEPGFAYSQRWLQADMTAAAGELDAAAALLDALVSQDGVSEARRARALLLRARTRGGRGEYAEGAADADEATRIHLLAGADDGLVSNVFFLAGALHEDAGAMTDAVARYRVATERREATGAPATDLRFRLGRALLGAGLAEEAIEVLDQVLQEETAAEEPAGSRAITVGLLTRAFEQAGQFGNALGGWEFAAQLHEEAEEPGARAYALKEHGRLLGRFGEIDDAIDSLTQAVELVRGDEEQVGLLADGLHTLAQAHQQRGDLDQVFALLDEAVELGRAHDAAWFVADVLDTRARALAAAERTDEAVATALQAADGFVQAGDETAAGRSEFVAARILVGAGRPADAVALYRAALEHAAGDDALRQTAALELGDVLEGLGRPAEAAEVRAILPA
jgi:tetratricopeptide (TPR) repeat protein